jgi:glutaredoxin
LNGGPRFWIVFFACLALMAWWKHKDAEPLPPVAQAAASHAGGLADYDNAKVRVTMYSLTTCPYCKAMNRELTRRNIPFVEYFVDAEPGRQRELTSKLERAGFRPGAIGTPILEVNGVMMPNNPAIRDVLRQLSQG